MTPALFQNIGAPEVVWIVLLAALLFGAKKIPELARSLGRSLSEFKKGRADGEKEAADAEARTSEKKDEEKR